MVQLLGKLKTKSTVNDVSTLTSEIKVSAGITKKESSERGVPSVAFRIVLPDEDAFEELFGDIGPAGMFEITITPLPN